MYSAEDSEYSDDVPFMLGEGKGKGKETRLSKVKGALLSNTSKSVGTGALVGTGLGLAGGLIAGSVGKEAQERKALKAKARAGRLTTAEQARYDELKANRRKKIAIGAGAGLVAGAGAGLLAEKTGHSDAIRSGFGATKNAKGIRGKFNAFKNAHSDSRVKYNAEGKIGPKGMFGHFSDATETTNDRSFSAIDLIGTPGNVTDKSFSTLEETKSGTQSMVLSILGK
jgi:hypothetical protein